MNPSKRPKLLSIRQAFLMSALMALGFMVVTAYQSAATLLSRVASTSVMEAATGVPWTGTVGRQIAYFAMSQIALHLAFGSIVWLVACATTRVWPALRVVLGRVTVLWFCAFAAAVIAYNAFWYPRTGLGAYYHDAMQLAAGPLPVGRLVYLSVVAVAAIVLLAALSLSLYRRVVSGAPGARAVALTAVVSGVLAAVYGFNQVVARQGAAQDRPHVILLGIDSLRLEELERFGGQGLTPNLDQFLRDADLVRDTTTPAARTFSSWTAILTGRSPTVTGVRFNLARRSSIRANPTLADLLRESGYRTVYSTDEVRFANIDESFGFDQVITPPIGAADFLIGTYNELPLATVVVNSRLGQLLFPFSYGNRGVATVFQPDSYLGRLERELSFDGPTLLVTHLTASHWPYYISDTPFEAAEAAHEHDRPLYDIGLRTADAMFGDIVSMLERKGALDNAIVVVLSDHGEALGLPGDSIFPERAIVEGLRAPLPVISTGHGQSVLSPVQYRVLLSFRGFGEAGGYRSSGRDVAGGSTVEDIAPTLLDLVGVPAAPIAATGLSMAVALQSGANPLRMANPDRVRYTETDLKVLPKQDGSVDEVGTAKENSRFFEIEPKTGRLSIRQHFAPLALAFKERAAFDERFLLAAIPAGPDAHQYILVDKLQRRGRLLLGQPSDEEPDARRLWDALWSHYSGELKPAVAITRDDWPVIDEAWARFPLGVESTVGATGAGAGG
jgi:hypothetical protein